MLKSGGLSSVESGYSIGGFQVSVGEDAVSRTPKWKFVERQPHEVDQDLTQRDQFNNDDIGLVEALVREVIQNSTDASAGEGPVNVRFSLHSIEGKGADRFGELAKDLRPHLEAVGRNASVLAEKSVDFLVIEDFGTTGLTGDEGPSSDTGNFKNFWRALGRSGKEGGSGGRWGLGKLVFSSSSMIGAFFGLTVRRGEDKPLLLGQSVLRNHEIKDKKYYWYGFYANHGGDGFQWPDTDTRRIGEFKELTRISRTTEPGLSVVVPYVRDVIEPDLLLKGVVKNYFFPILSGDLTVQVDGVTVDAESFDNVARGTDLDIPVGFVRDVSSGLKTGVPDCEGADSISSTQPDEEYFPKEDLDRMRGKYSSGKLVHVRLPLEMTRSNGKGSISWIDLFLQRSPDDIQQYVMFVRGHTLVKKEQRWFDGTGVFGAMIAEEENIVGFLGDAENPAHTGWNEKAEKLGPNWQNPHQVLRAVRKSLKNLYGLLDHEQEGRDVNVLREFFSIPNPERKRNGGETPDPSPDPPSSPVSVRIGERKGGFSIVPGPGSSDWTFPKTFQVKVAFDVIGADPFRCYSTYDFDFMNGDIVQELSGAEASAIKSNVLEVTVRKPEFKLIFSGFDKNRDIHVKVDGV